MFIYIFSIILLLIGASIIKHIYINTTLNENKDIKEHLLISEKNIIEYEGFDNC